MAYRKHVIQAGQKGKSYFTHGDKKYIKQYEKKEDMKLYILHKLWIEMDRKRGDWQPTIYVHDH